MERRIFLATKGKETVGVNFNVTENKPMKFQTTFDESLGEIQGRNGTLLSALHALTEYVKNADTEELTSVATIFVNQDLYEFLQNETYKSWLLTGIKKTTKVKISETERTIIENFVEVWKDKGLYFTVKDMFKCRISDTVVKDENKLAKFNIYSRQNNAYCRYAWSEVEKIVSAKVANSIANVI